MAQGPAMRKKLDCFVKISVACIFTHVLFIAA
jgi:hypothetical protein